MTGRDSIEMTFQLTAKEVLGVQQAVQKARSQGNWTRRALVEAVFLGAIMVLAGVLILLSASDHAGLVVMALGVGYFVVLLRWRWQFSEIMRFHRTQTEQRLKAQGPVTARLDASGVQVSGRDNRSQLDWVVFSDVRQSGDYLALSIGASAMVLPTTALPSDLSPPDAIAQIEAWRASA